MQNPQIQSLIAFLNRNKYIAAGVLLFLFFIFILIFSALSSNKHTVPQITPTPTSAVFPANPNIHPSAPSVKRIPSIRQAVPSTTPPTQKQVQDQRAVSTVENLNEVQAYKQSLSSSIKVITEVDSPPSATDNSYLIHVYELVPNGDGTAHTATFGWYKYDPATGSVIKQK